MKPSISLAMIVKDEEEVFDRCLSSVKDVVDEIIIVATGTNPQTTKIAKKYTDKVFPFTWVRDFSKARNYSFEQCTKEWIIWLDSDDEVPPADCEKIRNLDFSDKDMIICDYFYAQDEFGAPSCNVPRERIIRRSLGLKWQKRVHEYLPMIGRQYRSNIGVWHHKQHGTSDRNIVILEEMIADGDYDSRDVFYLAKEYQDAGRQDEALERFAQFVTMPGAFWEDVFRSYHYMAQIWLNKGDEAKFKENLFKSIEIEERRAELYCQMGEFYMGKSQWDKAIHWYKIAANTVRPKELLSTYQPEYYSWLPCLQLCVCYNNIGNVNEAYKWNEKVLEYRSKDQRALNNRKILKPALKKDQYLKEGEGKKLNLGCGGKALPGYWNCDLFQGKGIDEVFGMTDIPYKEGTIGGIYSEHSLEHLAFDQVNPTLKEWLRVLQPGGELILKLPDLDDCCRAYIKAPVNADSFFKTRHWFKCTIFGIQKSQAGEPDEAQFHRSGFSREEMSILLKGTGFIINDVRSYDGWGTPSMEFRAVKPVSNLKIGWIAPDNWDAAQTRIRVLKVNKWLQSRGYHSTLTNYPEIINENYDVCIIGKAFSEDHFKNVRMLKQSHKTVYCDLCEDIVGWPWVDEILSCCDKVIVCSPALAERVKPVNANVEIIEDAWE